MHSGRQMNQVDQIDVHFFLFGKHNYLLIIHINLASASASILFDH